MTETKKYSNPNHTTTVLACVTIIVVAMMIALSFNYTNDRNNMAKNIEAAITKGVDPIAVKCAYETNPTATCITYALNVKK